MTTIGPDWKVALVGLALIACAATYGCMIAGTSTEIWQKLYWAAIAAWIALAALLALIIRRAPKKYGLTPSLVAAGIQVCLLVVARLNVPFTGYLEALSGCFMSIWPLTAACVITGSVLENKRAP